MAKITKKFITNDAVDASKVKFLNDTAFRARNSSDTADVELFSYNSADIFEFLKRPQVAGDATEPNQVVTKKELQALEDQINGQLEGLKPKEAVRVATTGPITLSGLQTIDGIVLAEGDRVLVKDQVNPADNGIYIVSAVSWSRSEDMNELSPVDEINGSYTFVQEGDTNKGKGYAQSGKVNTIGVDAINFVFFNSNSELLGGDGISIVGTLISVDIAADSYMEFDAGQLKNKVSPTFADAASGELMDAQDIKDAVDTKQDILQGAEAIEVNQDVPVVKLNLDEGSGVTEATLVSQDFGFRTTTLDLDAFDATSGLTMEEIYLQPGLVFIPPTPTEAMNGESGKIEVRVIFGLVIDIAGNSLPSTDIDLAGDIELSSFGFEEGDEDEWMEGGGYYFKLGPKPTPLAEQEQMTFPITNPVVRKEWTIKEVRRVGDLSVVNFADGETANYQQGSSNDLYRAGEALSLTPKDLYSVTATAGSDAYLEQSSNGLKATVSPSFADAASGELMDAEDIKDAVDAVEVKADDAQAAADAAQVDATQALADAAAAQGTADQAIIDAATAQAAADLAQQTADGKQDPISAGDGIDVTSDVVSVKLDGSISEPIVITTPSGSGIVDVYQNVGSLIFYDKFGPALTDISAVVFNPPLPSIGDPKVAMSIVDGNGDVWEFNGVGVMAGFPEVPSLSYYVEDGIFKNGVEVGVGGFSTFANITEAPANTIDLTYQSGSSYLETSVDGLKAKVAEELASAVEGELADASQIKTKFEEIQQEIDDLIIDLPNYVGVEAIVVDDDAGVDGEISLKLDEGGSGSTDLVVGIGSTGEGTYEFVGAGDYLGTSIVRDDAGSNAVYLKNDSSPHVVAFDSASNGGIWRSFSLTPSQASVLQSIFAPAIGSGIIDIVGASTSTISSGNQTENGLNSPNNIFGLVSYVAGSGSSEVSYLSQSVDGLKAVVADDYASAGADQLMDAQDIKDQFQVVEDTKQDNISAGDGIEIDSDVVSVKLDNAFISGDLVIGGYGVADGTYPLLGGGYVDGDYLFKNGGPGYGVYFKNDSAPRLMAFDTNNEVWKSWSISSIEAAAIETLFVPPIVGSIDLSLLLKSSVILTPQSEVVNGINSPASNAPFITYADGSGGSAEPYLLNSANGLKAKVAVDYASAQAGELMDADDIKQAIDAAGHESVKQTILLTTTNIANGYVDLDQVPKPMSCDVTPVGGPLQEEGVDYVISGNRLTFAGDLSSDLAVGDKLMVKYVF